MTPRPPQAEQGRIKCLSCKEPATHVCYHLSDEHGSGAPLCSAHAHVHRLRGHKTETLAAMARRIEERSR